MAAQALMLTVRISKRLRDRDRVFDLRADFSTDPVERRIVFFGPSGSGKTLTMRAIAGLIKPDSGLIRADESILYDSEKKIWLRPQKRGIGYLPQDYALFPHLTVLQNVAFARSGLLGRFLTKSEKNQAAAWLERFEISKLGRQHPGSISGGQKQRVALARALNSRPALLLLDEPFSALDPLLRETMRREILEILDSLAITAIIVSHDPEDVAAFAGSLVLFGKNGGRLVANWPEILARSANVGSALRSLLDGAAD